MWSPANLGHVFLSHQYILSLNRLGLIPVLPSSKVPSFSTPLQDMLLYCNASVHYVGLSHAPMLCGWMIFSEVITKVNVSWFPFYLKEFLFQLITYPIKLHVHGFSTFLFDGSSHNSICRGILCDDFSGLLQMNHLSQGRPKCLELSCIVE